MFTLVGEIIYDVASYTNMHTLEKHIPDPYKTIHYSTVMRHLMGIILRKASLGALSVRTS